jgi:hypothetical protein
MLKGYFSSQEPIKILTLTLVPHNLDIVLKQDFSKIDSFDLGLLQESSEARRGQCAGSARSFPRPPRTERTPARPQNRRLPRDRFERENPRVEREPRGEGRKKTTIERTLLNARNTISGAPSTTIMGPALRDEHSPLLSGTKRRGSPRVVSLALVAIATIVATILLAARSPAVSARLGLGSRDQPSVAISTSTSSSASRAPHRGWGLLGQSARAPPFASVEEAKAFVAENPTARADFMAAREKVKAAVEKNKALFKAARTKGQAAKKAFEEAVAKRAAFEPLKSAPPSPEKMAAFKAMKEAMKKVNAARKEFKEAKAAAQAGRKEVRDLVKDAAPLKMKAKRLSVAKKYIYRQKQMAAAAAKAAAVAAEQSAPEPEVEHPAPEPEVEHPANETEVEHPAPEPEVEHPAPEPEARPDRRAEIPDPENAGSVIEVLHAVGAPDDDCYHILPDGSKSETMPCPHPADSMDSMPGSTMDSMNDDDDDDDDEVDDDEDDDDDHHDDEHHDDTMESMNDDDEDDDDDHHDDDHHDDTMDTMNDDDDDNDDENLIHDPSEFPDEFKAVLSDHGVTDPDGFITDCGVPEDVKNAIEAGKTLQKIFEEEVDEEERKTMDLRGFLSTVCAHHHEDGSTMPSMPEGSMMDSMPGSTMDSMNDTMSSNSSSGGDEPRTPDRRAEIPDPENAGSVTEVLHAAGTPDDDCYHILPDGSKSETMPCPHPADSMDSMPGSTVDSMPGSTVDCVVPDWCSTYPPEMAKEKPECQCPESLHPLPTMDSIPGSTTEPEVQTTEPEVPTTEPEVPTTEPEVDAQTGSATDAAAAAAAAATTPAPPSAFSTFGR